MSNTSLITSRPPRPFYGVQLNETAYRHWDYLEGDRSRLSFSWEDIQANASGSVRNIMIAVAQAYPKAEANFVKSLANTIKQTDRINIFDPIMGIAGQAIEQVGFISSKTFKRGIEPVFDVEWVTKEEFGWVEGHIFREDAELQILKPRQLSFIEQQFGQKMELAYKELPAPVHQSDDYESFRAEKLIAANYQEELKYIEEARKKKSRTVTVFYGTNRDRIVDKKGTVEYGNAETRELKQGVCEVNIPRDHERGQVELQGKLAKFIHWPANENEVFVIKGINELNPADFLNNFVETLQAKPKKQALLFVHGYNTRFDEAAYRAAQLAWDLPFKGYTGFFSWPSHGKKSAYGNDDAAARSSANMLRDFIKTIAGIGQLENLHIIAHSMGSLVLTLSLQKLEADKSNEAILKKIAQLVLAAPDIDKGDFFNNIMESFTKVGGQRTLYVSERDEALKASSSTRSLRDRLGSMINGIFVAEGIDTVDTSDIREVDNHSYVFEAPEMQTDLFNIINLGQPPQGRRLTEVPFSPVNYWLMSE